MGTDLPRSSSCPRPNPLEVSGRPELEHRACNVKRQRLISSPLFVAKFRPDVPTFILCVLVLNIPPCCPRLLQRWSLCSPLSDKHLALSLIPLLSRARRLLPGTDVPCLASSCISAKNSFFHMAARHIYSTSHMPRRVQVIHF